MNVTYIKIGGEQIIMWKNNNIENEYCINEYVPTNETCRIIQFIIKTGNSTIAMRLMKSIWNRMYFHKHTKNLIINISVN